MNKRILLTATWCVVAPCLAGQTINIHMCYDQARQNFPQIKQKELLAKSKEYSMANARTGYLPQFSILGQATYQSDVTRVPIEVPGFAIKALPKDQYRIYAEVSQSLYDGGTIRNQNSVHEANASLEDQRVEVELYKIKERINQLYFGTLLIDKQVSQLELVKKDLQSSLQRMESAIRNGLAFKTNLDVLQAELLKTEQRAIELNAGRKAYLEMLGLFIHQELSETTVLELPPAISSLSDEVGNRPELAAYGYQSQLLAAQHQLNSSKILPRVNLFFQGGYGRPGLNMLNSEFATYYIGGLRLNWNLSGFYNTRRDKEQLVRNLQGIDLQRETFLFNTQLTMRQQKSEVEKMAELIAVDEQIIELRARIKNTAKTQLDNGVITATDYLRELNAEDQARQNKALHEIQLLMTQYNYAINTGPER